VAQIKLIGIDGQGFLVSRLSLQAETELLEVRQLLADTEFQKTAEASFRC
jgi:DNA-binding GntR family transcriptional regulator